MKVPVRNSFDLDEQKAFNIVLGVWLFLMLAGVALWAVIIYVSIHFIGKVW